MGIFLALVIATVVTLYWFFKRTFNYWSNLGIQQFPTTFPEGNFKGVGKTQSIAEFTVNYYRKTKEINARFSGLYMLIRPSLLIVDLDLIKTILIKDFNVFPNRGNFHNEKDDPISAHLFNLEDDPWRNLRQKLTPTFTSGKLKMMFGTISEVADKLLQVIDRQIEATGQLEVKDTLARFTTDVIGTTAFGIDCSSLEDKNSKFYEMGTKIFNTPGPFVKRILMNLFKETSKKLGVKPVPEDISSFYLEITKQTVEYQKARQSVKDAMKKHENQLNYDSVADMDYLEQCVDETLRKYPVVVNLQRTSREDYRIPDSDVNLPKGSSIVIPVYAIHHDASIYPEPEKFIPDRFTTEEKAKRHPCAYIPFGEGPRICIGMRFGIVETKLGLAKLLLNYKFTLDRSKTSVPLKISPTQFVLTPTETIMSSLKHDFGIQYAGMISNIEDILLTWKDRVTLSKSPSKVAVLTGGNRGIGIHVLKKLLECDMNVVLGVRDPIASKKAVEDFIKDSTMKGKVFYEKCDTGDLSSVKNFAKNIQDKFSAIHILINNAGILFVPYQKTNDGFESQMAVNYLGHFMLTHLLMPQLIAGSLNSDGKNSRVVNVSSCANEVGRLNYDDFNYDKYYHSGLAYGDSKLAQIAFTKHLDNLCRENNWKVQCHAAHPGIVDTEIYKHSVWSSLKYTAERGSRTVVYAAISPDLEDAGGNYLNNCRISKPNKIVNNKDECKKFFDFTCNMLGIEDFGKKWRKLKFEARMSVNGMIGSTIDLFYKSFDNVVLYPKPNKVAVITGGNRGLGLAVIQKFLECDMTVVMGVRNPEESRRSVEKAFEKLSLKGKVLYEKCDTGDMSSVRSFAKSVKEKYSAIHVLVNNAGILSVPRVITKDGFVSQMAVNYLGHFLLNHLLMPQVIAGSTKEQSSRIVSITSCVHSIGEIRYDDFTYANYYRFGMVYSDSKLAQVMFSSYLQYICKQNNWNVQAHSAHPGIVNTDIFSKSFMGPWAKLPILKHWFKSPERGSRAVVYAAISPDLEGKPGTYISNCRISKPHWKGSDPIACKKLFDFTCALLNIRSFGTSQMGLLALVIILIILITAILKFYKTDEFPKKWRKLKFEARMSWVGISGSTIDLFYRSVDNVVLYPKPNKVAVITGGNRGLGLAVIQKFLECDMTVVMGVRNPEESRRSVEKAFEKLSLKGKVLYEKCDTGDMSSVRSFAKSVKEKYSAINILVNNAGILASPRVLTKDGFISQMAVNYIGHFLLTHLLLPQLIAGSTKEEKARVVNVASSVHCIGEIRYDDFIYENYYRFGMAYSDSKLAQAMFTFHLQKICREHNWNVQVHSAHPGMVITDIFNKSFMGPWSKLPILHNWFKSPEQGSRSVVYAAISPDLEGKSGTYISNCQIITPHKKASDQKE
ncbi:CLUMA_CG007977, isoform A [Clunio marinus]|uniref:CLUMA_CG007977, isoform A n=1 Tax=Clunio marinus TaxID=568069 RepID=A0A1J1I2A5_9DIPT|nr:CLUMA_CG007977, isoform A [Clunio marinus]